MFENIEQVITTASLVFNGLWFFAKITPTKKDDQVIGKIQKLLSTL